MVIIEESPICIDLDIVSSKCYLAAEGGTHMARADVVDQ